MIYHDIVFLVVWIAMVYGFIKERKSRLKAESELSILTGEIVRLSSESAVEFSKQLDSQAPIVSEHQQILSYLKENPGLSVDEVKKELDELKNGIIDAKKQIGRLTLLGHDENEVDDSLDYHRKILNHLRQNPGTSVDEASKFILDK